MVSDARRRCCGSRYATAALVLTSSGRELLGDLRRLTGVRFDAQPFAERARALLLTHWRAVTALASALVEDRRIEGDRVEAIIDHSMNTPDTKWIR